ncbi:DUF4147 domain-containing protein [Myxococcota bacterium]|nr:DUF4147 domain-containing protein [Myxococcota bacterium]
MFKTNQQLREDAQGIWDAAILAVQPKRALRAALSLEGCVLRVHGPESEQSFDLGEYKKVIALGAGKASAAMAVALEGILGERLDLGLVITKYDHSLSTNKIEIREAAHPLPDEAGHKAAQEIWQILQETDEQTLIIFLLSGGASALMPHPLAAISLEEKSQLTQALLLAGADISELNTLRKHLSGLKGGGLMRAAYPATVVSLIISDVVGDTLSDIGSGPSVVDNSTPGDARKILKKYSLWESCPSSVRASLEVGVERYLSKTDALDSEIFQRSHPFVIATNKQALEAAQIRAEILSYKTQILSSRQEGETRETAREFAAHAHLSRDDKRVQPLCFLLGGETTLVVRGSGKGGRNQEFALAAAREILGAQRVVVASVGTDGTDGPTDAAGAIADGATLKRAKELKLDFKRAGQENNCYPFFKEMGDLIVTGPTGTNVMDLHLLLVG